VALILTDEEAQMHNPTADIQLHTSKSWPEAYIIGFQSREAIDLLEAGSPLRRADAQDLDRVVESFELLYGYPCVIACYTESSFTHYKGEEL